MIETKEKEARKVFESHVKSVGSKNPYYSPHGGLETTELYFAKQFASQHLGKIMYTSNSKNWLVWEKPIWKKDDVALHERYKMFIDSLYLKAKQMRKDNKKKFLSAIKNLQKNTTRQNVLDLASLERGIRIDDELIDCQAGILNCRNVMIDLSGTEYVIMNEHDKEKLICKQTGIDYDEKAKCQKFIEFLNVIFDGNVGLIDFIQKAIGYSLTGYTSEQCLFFMYGTGRNGKSTFSEILKLLFGDYYYKANIEIILDQKGNSTRNDIAALKGKRTVITSEITSGKKSDESMIKDLTGGDDITVRYLYKEFFTFKPELKLWMYGNHKPVITGCDEGIKRRVKLIPFNVRIPECDVRPMDSIMKDMKEELPGILNWALKGFNNWRTDKRLLFPNEVEEATKEYYSDMDKVQIFLDYCCTFESSNKVTAKAMFDKYLEFCSSDGDKHLGKRTFESQLKTKNLKLERKSKGVSYWMGVDVKKGD